MADSHVPERSTLYHFTVSATRGPAQDDVATLLRHVADALDGLGALDVHDITFHVDWNEQGPWPSMTVYYELDEDDEAPQPHHDTIRDGRVERHTRVTDDDADDDVDGVPRQDHKHDPVPIHPSVFVLDRAHEPFVGSAAQSRDENGSTEHAETVVDVVAAEAAEQEPVPVIASIPIVSGVDDVLPALPTVAAARPISAFPVRVPPGVDRPALRRLKDLWRQSSRRRTGP